MKKIPSTGDPIWGAWLAGGALAGNASRPHGRVTVEPGYHLNLFSPNVNVFPWGPIRWWQRASNSQTEIEIPNIMSIEHELSIDSDAGTFTITFKNTVMNAFGFADPTNPDTGHPGYFTPDRGARTNRWGYQANSWAGVLTANACVRIYTGYGGDPTASIASNVASGHLVLSFVGLTDDPVISTDGTFKLQGRSMAKLLLDQQVWGDPKPENSLVPYDIYPISFYAGGVAEEFTPTADYSVASGKTIVGIQHSMLGDGYWLVGDDGMVFAFGNVHFWGSPAGLLPIGYKVIGMSAIQGLFPDVDGHMVPVTGYWVAAVNGNTTIVYGYGNHPPYGGAIFTQATGSPTVAIEAYGTGFILVDDQGQVYASPGTTYLGGHTPSTPSTMVAAACRPQGDGYWLVDSTGHVYAFGAANGSFGNAGSGQAITGICSTPSGNGYTICDRTGGVFNFGDSTFRGGLAGTTLQRDVTDVAIPPSKDATLPGGQGYWLTAQDGGVFTFSTTLRTQNGVIVYAVNFWGSLPGPFHFFFAPNYTDFTDIVRYFLLWAGFNFYDGTNANVYGNLESTGTHSPDILDATVWDKKTVMNAITTVKAIVGYLFYVGDEGEAHFTEPNFWQNGNVLRDSSRTLYIPVVDEKVQISSYERSNPDQDIRSQIIIASDDQSETGGTIPGTTSSVYTPSTAAVLKGMVNPAMWVNSFFVSQSEIDIMAQLVALHIYFRSQLGSLEMLANPMIQIDDQIQIVERQTFETNVHYVRGVHTKMDMLSGKFTQTLTTNILSPDLSFSFTKPTVTEPDGTVVGTPGGSIATHRP